MTANDNDDNDNDKIIVLQRTPEQWASYIGESWQKAVTSIIETGRRLIEARNDPSMKHGDWEKFIENKLPFSKQIAFMLISVAEHPIVSNVKHVLLLPPSYSTLYELTKVPDKTLEKALQTRKINPGMERKEAVALRSKKKSSRHRGPKEEISTEQYVDKLCTALNDKASELSELEFNAELQSIDSVVDRLTALKTTMSQLRRKDKKAEAEKKPFELFKLEALKKDVSGHTALEAAKKAKPATTKELFEADNLMVSNGICMLALRAIDLSETSEAKVQAYLKEHQFTEVQLALMIEGFQEVMNAWSKLKYLFKTKPGPGLYVVKP